MSLPPPPPSMGATPPPAGYQPYQYQQGAPVVAYAGFGSRLGARIIDGLVGFAMMIPFAVAAVVLLRMALDDCFSVERFDGTTTIECPDGALKVGPLVGAIGLYLLGVIVVLVIYCRWVGKGQTPGMKATNIRVADANTGQPIGTGRAVGRYFAQMLSALPCYLGFLWMLWDPKKQTWHDKMVRSVVVKT